MRTIKLTIEYDGTNFCGWQIQPNGISVQGSIQAAIRKMNAEENHVIGASRTDAGVHAIGQVAHFKTNTMIPPPGFLHGVNSLLKRDDLVVIKAEEATADFHAQKDAKSKLYRYMILQNDVPSALSANRLWHIREKLDVNAMKKASRCLIGKHDFKSFQAAGSSAKDAVRVINEIKVTVLKGCHPYPEAKDPTGFFATLRMTSLLSVARCTSRLYSIDISGNGFVYHMVRNIVGTLVWIGKGKLKPSDMEKILKARERKRAGATAPAHGLYLVSVNY